MEPEWWTDLRETLISAGRPDLVGVVRAAIADARENERSVVVSAFTGWMRDAPGRVAHFLNGGPRPWGDGPEHLTGGQAMPTEERCREIAAEARAMGSDKERAAKLALRGDCRS